MSKRNQEGTLLLDHRDSPGIPAELLIAMGLPADVGRKKFECATFTCNHCQRVINVVRVNATSELHPKGYCSKCDHYICEKCEGARAAGLPCKPFRAVVNEILEKVDKGLSPLEFETNSSSEVVQSSIILTT